MHYTHTPYSYTILTHRFPVWWTGDGVDLQASMESMVDSSLHGFKTYVHSDCGGDYR
jgi:hypothetical protein